MDSEAVREMRMEDLVSVLDLVEHGYLNTEIGKTDKDYDRRSTYDSLYKMCFDLKYHCLVYEESHEVIGCLIFHEICLPTNSLKRIAIETALDTSKKLGKYKRGKISIKLFKKMMDRLKGAKIQKILVCMQPYNDLKYYLERLNARRVEIVYQMEI